MPKIFIFCHGWSGHGNNLWFKTTIPEVEKLGCKVIHPTFPESKDPRYEPWRATLLPILEENYEGNEIYFVTHSMGGYFVLRLLGEEAENANWTKSVKGGVLVSSSATKRPEYKPMYDKDINWSVVKKLPIAFTVIWSQDDPTVKSEHAELIRKELYQMPNFNYLEFNGFGHFCIRDSPEIIEAIKNIIQ